MKNINKFVEDAFHQLDLFLDSNIKPKGGKRRFYCTSLSNLVYWGLIYGIKNIKYKFRYPSCKMKIFIEFKDGAKWHTRFCIYKNGSALSLFDSITQAIRDNDYKNLTHKIDLMRKKLKRGKFV